MVAVDILDTLIFTEENSNEIRLRCSGLGVRREGPASAGSDRIEFGRRRGREFPRGSENLVVKAAQLLREHAGVDAGSASRW